MAVVVQNQNPADGEEIATDGEPYLELDAGADYPTAVVITASIDGDTPEPVLTWDDEFTFSWGSGYSGSSFDATDPHILLVTIVRTGGWPAGSTITLAVSGESLELEEPFSESYDFTIASPATVQAQDPLGADPCSETTTEPYFEVAVTGDEPTAIVLTATIDGDAETVLTWTDAATYSWGAGYDGSSFAYAFSTDSLLEVTVVRTGGWPPSAAITMAISGELVGGGAWSDSWAWATCGERDTATCTAGQARLIEVLKRPRVQRYLCILLNQVDDLIGAVGGVLAGRSLSTAIGIQLDRIGQLYGFLRQGADDATYRARLQALAVVAGSAGAPDELLDVLLTLDDGDDASSIAYVPHYPAAFILTYTVAAGAWLEGMLWGEILRRADPSGVQSVLLFYERDVDIFGWSGESGVGWDAGIWAEGF